MATTDAPTPIPGRASDAERRRIARLLQERSTQGRLSRDTFAARVERALTARSRAELDDLVADVRRPGPVRRAAIASIGWLSTLTADVQSAWQVGRTPVLALPAHPTRPTTIGRSIDCDCVINEPSVSRRHAQVRRHGGGWLLRDLGSSNGTRVNGMRVTEATDVRPGDHISLGGVRYRLASR
ncbi:MAG: FHA domain-containing protein [Thermoleophilaceae bacterium]|nr:FHA domain-containing protein [Thermoleophilaceae bacterium]